MLNFKAALDEKKWAYFHQNWGLLLQWEQVIILISVISKILRSLMNVCWEGGRLHLVNYDRDYRGESFGKMGSLLTL